MNNKIILTVFALTSCHLISAPYVGLKIDAPFSKSQLKTDNEAFSKSFATKFDTSSVTIGVLVGYNLNMALFSFFTEADISLNKGDFKLEGKKTTNAITREELFALKNKMTFGLMPGMSYSFTSLLSGFWGVRLSATRYDFEALNKINNVIDQNYSNFSKNIYLIGVEPTVGINVNIGSMTTRIAVSYMYTPRKKRGYKYAGLLTGDSTSSLKSSGIRASAALIYNF